MEELLRERANKLTDALEEIAHFAPGKAGVRATEVLIEVGCWKDTVDISERPDPEKVMLVNALERLLTNARHIFDKQPVRDWDETLVEAERALGSFPDPQGRTVEMAEREWWKGLRPDDREKRQLVVELDSAFERQRELVERAEKAERERDEARRRDYGAADHERQQRLEAERKNAGLRDALARSDEHAQNADAENREWATENKALRAALGFYADRSIYGGNLRTPADLDNGAVARQALATEPSPAERDGCG